jgi:hypothetical protein
MEPFFRIPSRNGGKALGMKLDIRKENTEKLADETIS